MVWIVTTKEEEFRLCNADSFPDVQKALNPRIVQRLFVEKQSDFDVVVNGDTILSRTKNLKVLSWVKKLTDVKSTGESPFTITMDDDKRLLKLHVEHSGVKTPRQYRLNDKFDDGKVYFVKPVSLGDSIGVDNESLCKNKLEVERKIKSLKKYHNANSMVEEYINGNEFTVAVINTKSGIVANAIQITSTNRYLDYETKISDNESYFPANNNEDVVNAAIDTYRAVNAKGYCRIDIIQDKSGIPYVLEINVCAGLGRNGYLYKCFELNSDISYSEMLTMILETANL